MFGRTDPPQQWSVHAEFTISHPGIGDPDNVAQTHTEQTDNSVRMTYSWNSQGNNNNGRSSNSETASTRSVFSEIPRHSGFQKGNLLFTSTPPRRPSNFPLSTTTSSKGLGVPESSGYGSDLLSPNSLASGSLLPPQPCNRKCRSTCNIVLSTNVPGENKCDSKNHSHCGRTQSLRCQTPSSCSEHKSKFYGCGDPWCHHLHPTDDYSGFSPVMEACEECLSSNTSASKPSQLDCYMDRTKTALSREWENRKDASVQTFDMVDKCTSPFSRVNSLEKIVEGTDVIQKSDKKDKAIRRKAAYNRRRTEPIYQRSQSPSSFTPDSLEGTQKQIPRRLTRSPKIGTIKLSDMDSRGSVTDSKSSDTTKKPRTVHIDVYCTGTDMESDSSSPNLSDTNDTASTPQTVFESQDVRITHKRADDNEIPFTVKKSGSKPNLETNKSIEDNPESDIEDNFSTCYPSKSSCSTMRDLSSSISSVPYSWTNYSMSSCAVPDDYDSVANTSWKDTFSDVESILQSKSSMAGTDSRNFGSRIGYNKTSSIDETPEIEQRNLLDTPSITSLQQSDSFEYANSEDKIRIKKMEELLHSTSPTPTWKSPERERKHLFQQKRMHEYLNKKSKINFNKSASRESDSDDSADSGKGWTFVKDDAKLERNTTIKRNTKDSQPVDKTIEEPIVDTSRSELKVEADQGSLSDSSRSPSRRSPSTIHFLQRLKLDPTLRSPFTIHPGLYTEQRTIAKRFGTIVNVFRKPGHHVGPVKNPDCLCDHCRQYYSEGGFRTRTRSVGDPPFQLPNRHEHFKSKPDNK